MSTAAQETVESVARRAVEARATRAATEEADARATATLAQRAYEQAWAEWNRLADRLIAAEERGRVGDRLRQQHDHAALVLDARYGAALNAVTASHYARERAAEARDYGRAMADERRKRERLAELSARREAESPEEREGRAALARVERAAKARANGRDPRSYPAVEDKGDGLAALDRERLRALCREHGLGVGGHKATVVERLRAAGVRAPA